MLSLLLSISLAYAGDYVDTLVAAREAIVSADYAKATEILSSAESIAPNSKEFIRSSDIAQIWYLRGVLKHLSGADPLGDWRQSLVMHLGHKWDTELISDESAQDAFIALKTEIQNRPIVPLQIPEKYGQAVLYVDGFMRVPADYAYQGIHFAQIKCPNGEYYGQWATFEKKIKWIKMCPYKFDVDDMPEVEVEDEWAMFSSMGADDEMLAPEVNLENEIVAAPAWDRINKPALYSAAGAGVTSTILYALALNGKNKFNDLSNPDIQSEADLDSLRASTNRKAITSATFGTTAVVLYFVAIWNLKNK